MFHPTLNAALSELNLVDLWPIGSNINYSQTVQHIVETGEIRGKRQIPVLRLISVYRDEKGRYETPVTYITN